MLNLADVPYIDSAGLGEIVRTYTTVSRQGGSLKLLNLTKRITDLLAITKLLTVFETYDNEADAVRSFSSSTLRVVTRGDGASRRRPPGSVHVPHAVTDALRRAAAADLAAPGAVDQEPARLRGRRCSADGCSSRARSRRAVAAFAIFCALSGAVYLFNDVADREADQRSSAETRTSDRIGTALATHRP